MSKIGIMGGTFNPIHNGHLAIAERALKQFDLDKILFITAGKTPHKNNNNILNANIRHKLVSIAIENYAKFEPYDYEINKGTYSYTYETLQHIKKTEKNAELFLIIGADSFHNITTWYHPRTIMELCTFLVYDRDGYDPKKDYEKIRREYYCFAEFIESETIDISSSMIRERLYKNEDATGLLPRKVLDFLLRNNLYSQDPGNFKARVKRRLKYDRYMHSIGVSLKAVELASLYGVDCDKAKVAAILHDCAKNIPYKDMLIKCTDYDVELDDFEKNNPTLIHAKLGAKIAEIEFGINDREVIDAIKWHTIGHPGMSDLAKVLYVADIIEPGRSFVGIRRLKDIASKDLNKAVEACARSTIDFNEAKGIEVHPASYELVEWLNTLPPLYAIQNN